MVELKLSYRPPYAWRAMIEDLKRVAIPGVESIDGDTYRRTLGSASAGGVVEVAPAAGNALAVRLYCDQVAEIAAVVTACRRVFDLDADPATIDQDLASDPLLRPAVVRLPGVRSPGAWSAFEVIVAALCRADSPGALAGLVDALGDPLATSGGEWPNRVFPSPAKVLAASATWPGARPALVRVVRHAALHLAGDDRLIDPGELIHRLGSINRTTREHVDEAIARVVHDPDAFVVRGDSVEAAAQLGLGADLLDLVDHARAWRPWRSYAAMRLARTAS